MTRSCVAINCQTRQSSKSKADGVSFHCIPSHETRRKLWLHKIRRENYIPKPYDSLCSNHFTEDSFIQPTSGKYKLLKKTSIPTIFNFPEHLKEKVKVLRRPLHKFVPLEDVPVETEVLIEKTTESRIVCVEHDHVYAISNDPITLKRKHIDMQHKVEELYYKNRLLQVKVCQKKGQITKLQDTLALLKKKELISVEQHFELDKRFEGK